MEETAFLIPILIMAFASLVAIAIYLERMVQKKKREYLKKRRLDVSSYHNVVSDGYSGSINRDEKNDFSSRLPGKDVSYISKKLNALEQIDI